MISSDSSRRFFTLRNNIAEVKSLPLAARNFFLHPARFFMGNTKRKITLISLILSVIGLLDSIYLLIIKITYNPLLCIQGLGDCWAVNTSRYSEIFGIPISLWGIIGYMLISLLLLIIRYNTALVQIARYGLFGLTLFGFLFSAYLTYVEFLILKAWCPFCILSAIIMTIIFIVSISLLKPIS